MEKKRPILVTGSHRSGTSWTGRMLSASPEVGYIHEPFNIQSRPGICDAGFRYWFSYVNKDNGNLFYGPLKRTLSFQYNVVSELKMMRSAKDVARFIRDYTLFARYRLEKRRPLIKDPIALFSAPWLAETFNMQVVILIRHPIAFVSSLKVHNMQHPFSHFLAQNALLNGELQPFREEIEEYVRNSRSVIDQAILLWRIIHYMILRYKERYSDWIFLHHEDLSINPLKQFRALYDMLDLQYSKNVEKTIQSYTNSENPGEVSPNRAGEIRRDSQANLSSWKRRLSDEETSEIRVRTAQIAQHFYGDDQNYLVEGRFR